MKKKRALPAVQSYIMAKMARSAKKTVRPTKGKAQMLNPLRGTEEKRMMRFMAKISLKTLRIRSKPYLETPYFLGWCLTGSFDDPGPGHARQGREKAVHLAIGPQVLDALSAVCLERAAIIVQVDTGGQGDKSVGESRRENA